jgi:hypothetical protein
VHRKRAWLAIFPLLAVGLSGQIFFHTYLGWLIGLAICAPLYHLYVPLVPTKS